MRIVRRVPTVKQQRDAEWRRHDRWTREVIRELGRLGHDPDPYGQRIVKAADGEPGRVYFTGVGALGLTVVVRVEPESVPLRILRVAVGRESFTPRQAALWLRKRSARVKRYLP